MKNRPLDLHCVPEHGYGNASSINPEEAMQFVAVAVDDDYFCVCSRGNNEVRGHCVCLCVCVCLCARVFV